jgi:molybdopterin synthase catalytic subunit
MSSSLIRVRLLSFGPLKSAFTGDKQWRELEPGATVGTLLSALRGENLIAASVLASAAVAVNQEYVKNSHVLHDADEVALLPPVSGGAAGDSEPLVRLQLEPIDAEAAMDALRHGADGAMCTFDGKVRNNTRGRQTLHLDYEAYEEMALREMGKLRTEAIARFGVREVAILHRLGRLVVGETSVLIVVASAHRGAAFEACRWVIDTLKKQVPIWKKEQFVDGAVWADGEPFPESVAGEAQ